jgi:NTP pyrophosphatase (non-canonical NTP hydrolase)
MNKEKIKVIAEHGELDRVVLKVVEEIFELGEVLTKYVTKRDGLKPPIEKIIEENGDVLARLRVLNDKLGIRQAVKQREEEKIDQVYEWVLQNPK